MVKNRDPRAVEQRVDVRERLDRRPRDGVEAPVGVADAPRPVRLAGEHRRRRMARRRVPSSAQAGLRSSSNRAMSGTGGLVREANSIVMLTRLFSPAVPAGRPITLGRGL